MISKNQIKQICSLQHKKFREQYQQFIIEGSRCLTSALSAGSKIDSIIYTKSYAQNNPNLINGFGTIPQTIVSDDELKKLSPSTSPSGLMAICHMIHYSSRNQHKNLIYLDQISDPGNMGTILRTASWFGMDQIALSPGCIDIYNPKVVRSAMGAHFHLSWIGELTFNELDDYTLLGADQRGETIDTLNQIPKKWALIMGSEAHGLSKETRSLLNRSVSISKIGEGESLNVGVAMGILLHQLTR